MTPRRFVRPAILTEVSAEVMMLINMVVIISPASIHTTPTSLPGVVLGALSPYLQNTGFDIIVIVVVVGSVIVVFSIIVIISLWHEVINPKNHPASYSSGPLSSNVMGGERRADFAGISISKEKSLCMCFLARSAGVPVARISPSFTGDMGNGFYR